MVMSMDAEFISQQAKASAVSTAPAAHGEHVCNQLCKVTHMFGNCFRCETSQQVHVCDRNCTQLMEWDMHTMLCRVSKKTFPRQHVLQNDIDRYASFRGRKCHGCIRLKVCATCLCQRQQVRVLPGCSPLLQRYTCTHHAPCAGRDAGSKTVAPCCTRAAEAAYSSIEHCVATERCTSIDARCKVVSTAPPSKVLQRTSVLYSIRNLAYGRTSAE